MTHPRRFIQALALLSLIVGCGDGTTDPVSSGPRVTAVLVHTKAGTLTAIDDTTRAVAEVLDYAGVRTEAAPVAWSSSDSSIVTVDTDGLVTAVGVGRATISAEAAGMLGSNGITVAQEVAWLELLPGVVRFPALRDTIRLRALARDANHNVVEDADVWWATAHPRVAVVDHTGLVRSVGEGETVISAEAAGVSAEAPLFAVQCTGEPVEIPRIDDGPFRRYFDHKIRLNPDSLRVVLEVPGRDRDVMADALVKVGLAADSIRSFTASGPEQVAHLPPTTSLVDARTAADALRADPRLTFVSLGYRTPSDSPYLPTNGLSVQFHHAATLEEITCLNARAGMTLDRERDGLGSPLQWLRYPQGAEPLSMAEFYYQQPFTSWAEPHAWVPIFLPGPPTAQR